MKVESTFSSLKNDFSARLYQMSPSTCDTDFGLSSEDYSDLLQVYFAESALEVRNEILANQEIPESEKLILNKLVLSLLGDEITFDTLEFEKFNTMADQLLALSDDNHPYAYFYHYLKGIVAGIGLNDSDLAIQHLSEAVRLNPDFEYAYGFRGMIHIIADHHAEGIRDIIQVIHMNKTKISELIAQVIKDHKIQM